MTGGKEGTNENQAMSNPLGKLRGPDIGQEGSEVDDLEAAIIGYQGKSIAPVSVEDLPVTKSSPKVVEEQLEPLQPHCIGHINPDQVQCGDTDESSPPKKNNCVIGLFEGTFYPGEVLSVNGDSATITFMSSVKGSTRYWICQDLAS